MEKKECITCKKSFAVTIDNFRRFKSGKWALSCKSCSKIIAKESKISRQKIKDKKVKPIPQVDWETWRALEPGSLRLQKGATYSIVQLKPQSGELYHVTRGVMVYQNDCYFILEDANKIRESFLKVDSLLQIYKLEKVSDK
jgi:hypothetical protein